MRAVSLRACLILALLLAPLPAAAAKRAVAPAGTVRLGVEGGAAWWNAFPSEAVGWAGTVRSRVQLTERFMASAALTRISQDFGGSTGLVTTTVVPVAFELRLDRAPLSPFFGGGAALLFVDVENPAERIAQPQFGGVFEAGLEWYVTDRLTLTGQVTYAGLGASSDLFPFYSTAGAGLAWSLW